MPDSPFHGKVSIITGAGSGLGAALARELARRGATLYLADQNVAGAELVANEIESVGGQATVIQLDVTNAPDVEALVSRCIDEHGRLDFMFNNAGIAISGELRDHETADIDRVIRTNLNGVIYGTHAASRVMIPIQSGHIVNIASMAGLTPVPGFSIYVASKHGVVGFSQSVRAELEPFGVRLTVACPGVLSTPIHRTMKRINLQASPGAERSAQTPEGAAIAILKAVAKNREMVITPWFWTVILQIIAWFPPFRDFLLKSRMRELKLRRVQSAKRDITTVAVPVAASEHTLVEKV